MKRLNLNDIFKPLTESPTQAYFGRGLHSLGLLKFILSQTGPADIYISTFSTSDAFLRGYYLMRKSNTIRHSVMLTDFKASRKTFNLYKMMRSCFDDVYLGMNHSKVMLISNSRYNVSVVTSQNQTYGDRAESTILTTSHDVFTSLYKGFSDTVNFNSVKLNGDYSRTVEEGGESEPGSDSDDRHLIPFGY